MVLQVFSAFGGAARKRVGAWAWVETWRFLVLVAVVAVGALGAYIAALFFLLV